MKKQSYQRSVMGRLGYAAAVVLCLATSPSVALGQERGLGPGGAVSETGPYVAQGGDNAPYDCTCTKIEIQIEKQDVVTTPFAVDEVRKGTVKWWINGDPNAQLCVEVWTEPTPEKTPHGLPSATFQWQHRPGGTQPFLQLDRFTTNCADGEREFKIKGGPEVSPTMLGSKMIVNIYRGPCPPPYPRPASICPPPQDIRFTVLKVELGEATFQGPGAHALKTDDGTYASDGTGDVRVPQIKAGAAPRETQICYTGGSSPEIHATFSIIPTLTSPVAAQIRIEGTQRNRSGTLIYEQDVVLNGSSVTETFTTPDTLKQLIDSTTYDLTWKLSLDGGSSSSVVDTTANRLFVTAGTPAGGASATRMEWDCGVAKDCANQSSCADKIHDAIAGDDVDPPFEQSDFEQSEKVSTGSGWMLLDGETYGLCNGQAALMAAAMGLLGY